MKKKHEHKYYGKTRIYHIKFQTTEGKTVYAQYAQERMNSKTINIVCNHRQASGKRIQKCDARITLKHTILCRSTPRKTWKKTSKRNCGKMEKQKFNRGKF